MDRYYYKIEGMELIDKNKLMILDYYRHMSGKKKTHKLLEPFVSDPDLITHILAVDEILPGYLEEVDEMTGEKSRVIVRSTCKGRFQDATPGRQNTFKDIQFPVAVGYYIERGKIVDHWMISDHMALLEQLGWLKNGISMTPK